MVNDYYRNGLRKKILPLPVGCMLEDNEAVVAHTENGISFIKIKLLLKFVACLSDNTGLFFV